MKFRFNLFCEKTQSFSKVGNAKICKKKCENFVKKVMILWEKKQVPQIPKITSPEKCLESITFFFFRESVGGNF